jgi:tripartite-type tricarboxylate transporter receptor subunit TctC
MITRRHFTASAAGLALSATGLVCPGFTQVGNATARILVGFPAGGTSDVIARLLAGAMKDYASSIIVENRPGGVGRLAIEALANAPADGSVFLLVPLGTMTLSPHVYKNLPYDPFRDFIPVTTIGAVPFLLTVSPKVVPATVKTLADFIAWCRANPTQATYGSPGAGSPYHFTGVQLARAAGFEYKHVPYVGPPRAVQDLLGGQIASTILPIDSTLPYIISGSLRALATTGPRRDSSLPDVQTIREAGYPSLEAMDWYGVFVPVKMPLASVDKLNGSIQGVLERNEVRAGLAKLSVEIDAISLGEFARLEKSEFDRWASVVQASGFTPED